MSTLDLAGRSAIVTGAGSGIGAAIARRLVAAGAAVVLGDIDADRAGSVAEGCNGPGTAIAARIDVSDAEAMNELVGKVKAEHGSLDMLFNNAGIGVGGETEHLTLADWDRVLDVNVRGVVHGIAAAYPLMVEQGHGRIVNTASLAGLLPAGLLTVYSMTKHAVVGLSLSLRVEAAAKGVKVMVVCPAAVETSILDAEGVGGFDVRRYVTTDQGVKTAMPPDVVAGEILEAVRKDKAILVTPRRARLAWAINRVSPSLGMLAGKRVVRSQRQHMAG